MDKARAVDALKAAEKIRDLLDPVPHGLAREILYKLTTIEAVLEEEFPGGYAGGCVYCDEPMGHDEAVRVGEEEACQSCWKERLGEMQSCEHELRDDTDEHGDPGKSCGKCGFFQHVEMAEVQ